VKNQKPELQQLTQLLFATYAQFKSLTNFLHGQGIVGYEIFFAAFLRQFYGLSVRRVSEPGRYGCRRICSNALDYGVFIWSAELGTDWNHSR